MMEIPSYRICCPCVSVNRRTSDLQLPESASTLYLYNSFKNMLPNLSQTLSRSLLMTYILYTMACSMAPIPGNNAYTHYVWQDTHGQGCAATSQWLKVDKRPANAGNVRKSLDAWDMQQIARSNALSTLSEISTEMIGLMIPSAVTTFIQLYVFSCSTQPVCAAATYPKNDV